MNKYDIAVVKNAANVCNIKTETPLENVVADCMKDYLEMRKAEEQGLLLRLPCPIGSDIYRIVHRNYGGSFIRTTKFDINNFFRIVINKEIGKTVFLTKEAAEQALAEMKIH